MTGEVDNTPIRIRLRFSTQSTDQKPSPGLIITV